MENKKVLQKNDVNKIKTGVTPIDKKDARNIMPEKPAEKKQRKRIKISSALLAASMERSVVDAVDTHSSKDVRGSSGLSNTGSIISYD